MRGPGEATGAFALECAIDELAFALKIDPLEFRLLNHTDSDPEKKLPWSTKYLKECFEMGSKAIGWNKRKLEPGMLNDEHWKIGYGMAVGTFGANRSAAKVRARLSSDGSLLLQSAITDIGPGTGTVMTQIAADATGIPMSSITFQLGNSQFPQAPLQGGSSTVNTVGPAVAAVCKALQKRLTEVAISSVPEFKNAAADSFVFADGSVSLKGSRVKMSLNDLMNKAGLTDIDLVEESKAGEERKNYSMYSYSVHFAEVHVHNITGAVKVNKVVTCADAGTIINTKTAGNQMIGGVTGGIIASAGI
jgi:xanthine dehydrogenase YagR molybdenum-binding subunit